MQALPQSISPAGSSAPWISGLPYAADAIVELEENLGEYLGTAVEAGLEYIQKKLQETAAMYPEWTPFLSKVGVEWADDGFQFYFEGTPEELVAMEELEYGFAPDAIPQSVTRKTAFSMESELSKILTDAFNGEAGLV